MDTIISSKINDVSSSNNSVVDNNESNLSQDANEIIMKIFNSQTETVIDSLTTDTNNQKENDQIVKTKKQNIKNQKTYESEEEHELDIIYNPSELDFQISAQLVQDAIYGTDIYFKHNRLSLM
jgi:hypothetical protein